MPGKSERRNPEGVRAILNAWDAGGERGRNRTYNLLIKRRAKSLLSNGMQCLQLRAQRICAGVACSPMPPGGKDFEAWSPQKSPQRERELAVEARPPKMGVLVVNFLPGEPRTKCS